jgi:hypothetical protein
MTRCNMYGFLPGDEARFTIYTRKLIDTKQRGQFHGRRMMRHCPISPATLCTFVMGLSLPLVALSAPGVPGPCAQIVNACKSAGFVLGDVRQGYGLWMDCVRPIMNGAVQPTNADKPLPQVPSDVVAACRQRNPNFGEHERNAQRPQNPANPPNTPQ